MRTTGYATAFLEARGQLCTIQRSPTVTSYVSMRRASRSTDPSVRDALWQGLILATSSLASGEVFTVGGDSYLCQSAASDHSSGETLWYALKCNATITHQRLVDTVDGDGNVVKAPQTLGTSSAWGQIVTARMRVEDPGLVDGARYVFQLPASLGVQELDRIVYGGTNYRVESVDDIAMAGVVQVQLGVDVR